MRPKLLAATLVVAALSLVLAACGGSDSSSKTSAASGSSASGSSAQEKARLQFTTCLRKQGIQISDDQQGPPQGVDQQKLQTAMTACQKYLQGAAGNISQGNREKFQDQATKFAACLRGKGLDVQDPDVSSGGNPGSFLQGIDQNDPGVQAKLTACQKQVGLTLPGGSGQ